MQADNDTVTDASADLQLILEAAAKHDCVSLQKYLDTLSFPDCAPADVLDPDTGRSPLHAAIASCEHIATATTNGESSQEEVAEDTVRLLLENGAIWNQLDKNSETPGCIAWRAGLRGLYQLMVDAGVRAELLLNRLEGYEQIDDDEVQEDNNELTETLPEETQSNAENAQIIDPEVNSADYLSSTLSIGRDKLLDEEQNGVMMEWERDIMKQSATAIMDQSDLTVLNIGAGMLIFDTIVQNMQEKPAMHHIVEAHPDVLADMQAKGWFEKPGVIVHAGKWQDVLPALVAENLTFDAIYFDTFAESYNDFKEFFSEQVVGLLKEDGKWSFFNGMGADRQISYDVYQQVAEMDLMEAGFNIEWQNIDIPTLDKEWEGVKRKYWNVDTYRLPICKYMN